MRILIATYPFGETGRKPLDLLEATGWGLVRNPYGRRLKTGEVGKHLQGVQGVIAGTEPYNAETLAGADQLKVIARVGIGLDSVDLAYCQSRGIRVTYTPEAPSDGVAELTVGNILNLLRHIHASDRSVREGAWNRLMGKLVREVTIGIIGVGRIGSRVIKLLEPFGAKILAVDTNPAIHGTPLPHVRWCPLDELLQTADVITVHIPLNAQNHHFVSRARIARMRTGTLLINTARGPVVDEAALTDALLQKHLGGAALDVFESEPYEGPLAKLDNVVLTAHIGASAQASRYLMELGAAEDCIRVLRGEPPAHDAIRDELGPAG
ncbi:MAG: phosphoglycerate dehydrogenase [Verrucomicrobia bacterium]|nr:phosphoglycerate dehydrogenase [Verrucomicrobiota bacterium]